MTTEDVRRVTVTGAEFALDLRRRGQLTKEQYGFLRRSPEAAKKIDVYTLLPEYIRGWTKYAREVSMYESEAAYVREIGREYTVKGVMGGGRNAI